MTWHCERPDCWCAYTEPGEPTMAESDREKANRAKFRTHSDRDGRKRKQAERNKAREALAREDKRNARKPQYRPNGPN